MIYNVSMLSQSHAKPLDPSRFSWPEKFLIAAVLLLAFGLLNGPLVDPDVFIHLRDGRYWVETGLHPGNDPFTYTVPDQPTEKLEWLFRIGLFQAWKIGGSNFLIVLKALGMTAVCGLFWLLLYRRWPDLTATAILLGLAMTALIGLFFAERPYIFTYLFLLLGLLWLDDYVRPVPAPAAAKKLWLFPALVVLWANLHPGFVIWFAFLGSQALQEALAFWLRGEPAAGKRLLTLSLLGLACFIAGSFNPVGFGIYGFVLKTVGSSQYMNSIIEWLPPEFMHNPVFFILLGLAWLSLILDKRRARAGEVILLLFFSFLAVKSRRNIALFLIAALPILAAHLQGAWQTLAGAKTANLKSGPLAAGLTGLMALAVLAGLTLSGRAFRWGVNQEYYPSPALAWMQIHNVSGRLYAPFAWGGYIGWVSRGNLKVFMDGRVPLYGEKIYSEYCGIYYGDPARCLALLDQYGIQAILVTPQNYFQLFAQLGQSGQWALVYWDHHCELFVRRQGANRLLAEKFSYRAVDPNATPYFNPNAPQQARQEIQRARAEAPHSYLPMFFEADLALRLSDPEKARPLLERVIALAPKHSHSYFDLAVIAFQTDKNIPQAEAHIRRALRYNQAPDFCLNVSQFMTQMLSTDPARGADTLHWQKKSQELMRKLQPPRSSR